MTENEKLLENALNALLTLHENERSTLLARLDSLEQENQQLRTQYENISQQLEKLSGLQSSVESLNQNLEWLMNN